jgi:tRNA 2-thiouridine synthesizing protein A
LYAWPKEFENAKNNRVKCEGEPRPAANIGMADPMSETESRFAKELDVTGHLCPMPILRARRVLDDMQPGEVLLVIASDPATVQDMPAFCTMTGNKLRMASVEEDRFLFEIERGEARPDDEAEAAPIRRG